MNNLEKEKVNIITSSETSGNNKVLRLIELINSIELKAFEAGKCLTKEDWEDEDYLDWDTYLKRNE